MSQKLVQTQANVQVQQLSALQVAVSKMVELPITELAQRIQNEMVDNAALEEKDTDNFTDNEPADDNRQDNNGTENDEDYDNHDALSPENDALGDYLNDDDIPDYLRQRAEEAQDQREIQLAGTTSFYEELQRQMGEHNLTEHEQEVMNYLIGSLDESGFLKKDLLDLVDELAIYHNTLTSLTEMEHLLAILQTFEPRGIGARTLQECLHIQLSDPDRRTPYTQLALTVVDRYFKDFTSRKWKAIGEKLKVDDETMEHVLHELTHLNPMPGRALNETLTANAPTIVPDFFVHVNNEGEIAVQLNAGDLPELRVSPAFRDSIKQYGEHKDKLSRQQRDAYTFARQKVDAAMAFINLLTIRKQTLLTVMQGIVHFQRDFFLNDDDETQLHPLTLREVAERGDMAISTVSRVTNHKYVQTDYGTYPLRFFFSSQITNAEGDEISARQIQAALRSLIEGEDKKHPLPDEMLAAKLKQQGYDVARRTVAKYRDIMGFPTARLRRE